MILFYRDPQKGTPNFGKAPYIVCYAANTPQSVRVLLGAKGAIWLVLVGLPSEGIHVGKLLQHLGFRVGS